MTKLLLTAVGAAVFAAIVVYALTGRDPDINVDVTIESIEKVAELATIRYNEAVIYPYTKPKKRYEWKNAKMLVLGKGTITGRVDLKKASIERDDEAKTVAIRFAKGAVLISEPEVKEMKIFTMSDPNIFNKLNDDDRNKATANALKALKDEAENDDIRAMTRNEAIVVLKAFVAELGYTATVEFAK